MKPIAEELFDRFIDVLDAANSGEDVRGPSSRLMSLYKKADFSEQGDYHARVVEFMKS